MKDVTPSQSSIKPPPKLLDQLRRCLHDNHYSFRTERAHVYWPRWYIRFHGLRHPMNMGTTEIEAFMSYLVNERNVAGATYTQALYALLFFCRNVLKIDLSWMEGISRPKKQTRRPTVLTLQEVL